MELKMRDPTTAESTYPFPRHFPFSSWLDRWEPMRWVSEQLDSMAIPVEEYVDDDRLVIRAELPGVDPDDDIELSVDGGMLHLRAERRERSEEDKPDRYRSELRYGSFSRSIRLPADASADDVEASYADGILKVTLPIDGDKAKAARIPINRE